ncbi:MAG: hypothetical protein EXS01_00480 [Phycisphaerales bacterium]|nr:hypothetical protein [Phycisphaerales bacterium]
MVGMSVAAMALGADRVFVGGGWESSTLWNTLAFALNLSAAFLGGIVATWWGGRRFAGYGLAVVILALGTLMVISTEFILVDRSVPPTRPAVMEF